jgi:hypothetical protein
MRPECSGIERRLDELSERLVRLEPLETRDRMEFDHDADQRLPGCIEDGGLHHSFPSNSRPKRL